MILLVNPRSGGPTWVHESRLEEYLAAGFKLAPPPPAPPRKTQAKKQTQKK